jgi:Uma2 family endonuclease
MSISTRITLAEYARMVAAGAFEGSLVRPRIELIDGELREMSPINEPHAETVSILVEWSFQSPPKDKVRIRVQCPIYIPERESAPEPDIVWAARKEYRTTHPHPGDILLLVEAAESSLVYDCGEKADLYASAGIADYWVVNLVERCVEVFRQPQNGRYETHDVFKAQDQVRPLAFPDVTLPVAMLFPAG